MGQTGSAARSAEDGPDLLSDIVQSLWIGDRLGALQQLGVRSFLAHGHAYHLYAYDDVADVPAGTTICDASAILAKASIFSYRRGFGQGSHSAFSNQFRYQLLFDRGGWWVDTDVVCLRPFDFVDDVVFAQERWEDGKINVASCVLKSPPSAEFLRYCLDVCESKTKDHIEWGEIGPVLLDDAVRRFRLEKHLVSVEAFNPVHYFSASDLVAPDFMEARIESSFAVHLWSQMWSALGMNSNITPPPNSLYGILRARYSG